MPASWKFQVVLVTAEKFRLSVSRFRLPCAQTAVLLDQRRPVRWSCAYSNWNGAISKAAIAGRNWRIRKTGRLRFSVPATLLAPRSVNLLRHRATRRAVDSGRPACFFSRPGRGAEGGGKRRDAASTARAGIGVGFVKC
jgi:hypothetical protein